MCQVVSDDQHSTHDASAAIKVQQANYIAPEETTFTSNRSSVQCGLSRRSKSDGELRPASDQQVTSAQLAQHNTEDDCWMAIKGKVNTVHLLTCLELAGFDLTAYFRFTM